MRLHLSRDRCLVGRLELNDASGILGCSAVVVARCRILCQPPKNPASLFSEPRTLAQDPVVIASGQQVACIHARCALRVAGRNRVLEIQHVHLARASVDPS